MGGNPDGKAVVAKMKAMPTDDPLFGKGTIRCRRPQACMTAYLFEVKKPAESKYPGDFYKLKATIPADGSFPSARRTAAARWSAADRDNDEGRAHGPPFIG